MTMLPGRTRVTTVGVTVALVLTGCTSPWSRTVVEQVDVTTTGFSPASVTVPAGAEVRWISQVPGRVSITSVETADAQPGEDPTTVAEALGHRFDSGPLDQGDVYSLKLEEPGHYVYSSTYQDDPNWVGAIIVEGP